MDNSDRQQTQKLAQPYSPPATPPNLTTTTTTTTAAASLPSSTKQQGEKQQGSQAVAEQTEQPGLISSLMIQLNSTAQTAIGALRQTSVSAAAYLSGRLAAAKRAERAELAENKLLALRLPFFQSRYAPHELRSILTSSSTDKMGAEVTTDERQVNSTGASMKTSTTTEIVGLTAGRSEAAAEMLPDIPIDEENAIPSTTKESIDSSDMLSGNSSSNSNSISSSSSSQISLSRQTAAAAVKMESEMDDGEIGSKGLRAWLELVDLGDGRKINTFIMEPTKDANSAANGGSVMKNNLVICHGFGTGLGLWYLNYRGLAQFCRQHNWRLLSIDWLGMGRSSRTPLPPRDWTASEEDDIEAVESYFVQSLEDWRVKMGLERMTLLGHSLGGYLSISYALRYPQRVDKLLLASPAGIPRRPLHNPLLDGLTANQKRLYRLFAQLWEWDLTPQRVVRATGTIGHRLIRSYCERRFTGVPREDLPHVIEYMYSISSLDGSGEYALNRLLAPGAWARRAHEDNIEHLQMPAIFLYGEYDWMNPSVPINKCKEGKLPVGSRVIIVPDSGHQLFLDNARVFNASIIETLLGGKK